MKAVNLMPPAKRKVVASVASFALACSMVPTAGVAWAAEVPEDSTEIIEPASKDGSNEDEPDAETPAISNEETPEGPNGNVPSGAGEGVVTENEQGSEETSGASDDHSAALAALKAQIMAVDLSADREVLQAAADSISQELERLELSIEDLDAECQAKIQQIAEALLQVASAASGEMTAEEFCAAAVDGVITLEDDVVLTSVLWLDDSVARVDLNGHSLTGCADNWPICTESAQGTTFENGTIISGTSGIYVAGGTLGLKNVKVQAAVYGIYHLGASLTVSEGSVINGGAIGLLQAGSGDALIESAVVESDKKAIQTQASAGSLTLGSGAVARVVGSGGEAAVAILSLGSFSATIEAGALVDAADATGTTGGIVARVMNGHGGKTAQLDVKGTVKATSNSAISGNGSDVLDGPDSLVINVHPGAQVSSVAGPGIYQPQWGTLNVLGGTITGASGIEVRAGNVHVTGNPDIAATGAFSANANNSGTTITGAAIAVSQHTTHKPINVTIDGGTLTGVYGLYEAYLQSGSCTDISLAVNGGTFTASEESGSIYSQNAAGFVTGGTFNSDVSEYCTDGLAAVSTGGTFSIVDADQVDDSVADNDGVAVAQVGDVYYGDLAAALKSAASGQTVTLLDDLIVDSNASSDSAEFVVPAGVTLDGNGHTLTAGAFANRSHMINVLAGGVTIKDVTIDMANATNSKHGINVHGSAAWATISNVTITNANTAAMVVNGSAQQGVTVNGLTTSGNTWGAINVDKGGTLIFNSGSLGEDNKIWTETDSASNITVNAPGIDSITTYDLGGSGAVMTYYAATDQVEQLAVADSDGAKFGDLQLAFDRAEEGATVTLLQDVEQGDKADDILLISKSITLDGAGHTVTSNAARIVRITTSDVTVSLKDVQLISSTAERGVQVDVDQTGVKLIMDGCVVTAPKYAVQLCSGAGAEIEVSNSTITGWDTFNVFSAGNRITVMNSTLNGHNSFAYSAAGHNNFGTIAFNDGAVGNALTLVDCTVTATSDTDNLQRIIQFNPGSVSNTVSFSGTNTVASYRAGSFQVEGGMNNAITISGGKFTDDVSEYCVPGKVWENGVVVDEATEPETPETPVTPAPDPEQPVTPVPAPQPQRPATQATPNAAQNTGAGVRFAPVVAAEEAAEEMGLVTPTEAAEQAFRTPEAIQDEETPLAKETANVAEDDQAGINWLAIAGGTFVVLLAAAGLFAALRRKKDQDAS